MTARTWEQAADVAASELYDYDSFTPINDLADASERLKGISDFAFSNFADIFHFALEAVSATSGEWGSNVIDSVVRTIISKQHDYGHQNILRHGLDGVGVRMDDKIARIQNLESRGVEAVNESLDDSYTDLMGYSIIGWMLVNGTFELPLEKDLHAEATLPLEKDLNFDSVKLVDVIVQMLATTIEHVVKAFEESEK